MTATLPPVTRADVPPEMAALDQWVLYRLVHRDGQSKPTKVPFRVDGRRPASSTDPATWAPLAHALAAHAGGAGDGIGFVFAEADGLWGLDLDNCCDVPFGPLAPEAAALVGALDTYAEYSPSGRGVHAVCRAVHPAGARHRAPLSESTDAEAYDRGRFFTFTGLRVYTPTAGGRDRPAPLACEDRQYAVDALARAPGIFAPRVRRLAITPPAVVRDLTGTSDDELLKRAFAARNGDAVRRLFYGDRTLYGSASEADMALVNHLLYWTGGDVGRADRLFRASGLMRDKWDEMRGAMTYGERTLEMCGGGGPVTTSATSAASAIPATSARPATLVPTSATSAGMNRR